TRSKRPRRRPCTPSPTPTTRRPRPPTAGRRSPGPGARPREPALSRGSAARRGAGSRIGALDGLDDVVTDGQRRAAVVVLADEVELRGRGGVAALAAATEAVHDAGGAPVQDGGALLGGRAAEELPVVAG